VRYGCSQVAPRAKVCSIQLRAQQSQRPVLLSGLPARRQAASQPASQAMLPAAGDAPSPRQMVSPTSYTASPSPSKAAALVGAAPTAWRAPPLGAALCDALCFPAAVAALAKLRERQQVAQAAGQRTHFIGRLYVSEAEARVCGGSPQPAELAAGRAAPRSSEPKAEQPAPPQPADLEPEPEPEPQPQPKLKPKPPPSRQPPPPSPARPGGPPPGMPGADGSPVRPSSVSSAKRARGLQALRTPPRGGSASSSGGSDAGSPAAAASSST
jgi:DNA polymerase-3 subunit gamma/tau